MLWASVVGSYGGPGESATRSWSPRRTRWRPLGLARRSGMRPSRTARRMVSSQTPLFLGGLVDVDLLVQVGGGCGKQLPQEGEPSCGGLFGAQR